MEMWPTLGLRSWLFLNISQALLIATFCRLSVVDDGGEGFSSKLLYVSRFPGNAEEIRYRAAAVEYDCPTFGSSEAGNVTAADFMIRNVLNYEALVLVAVEQQVDMVVFPEYGLTSLGIPADRAKARPFFQTVPNVPSAQQRSRRQPENSAFSNPCDEFDSNDPDQVIVKRLSCMARAGKIYVVVDLAEVVPCDATTDDSCPEDNQYFFNAAVAFDRNGAVVAKYRKINLYLEPQMDVPSNQTHVTFKTDFGVEFGIIICFDIMFEKPLIDIYETGVRDIIFPTAWIDGYPMFLGHQVQSFTAIGLESNLIASNYHNPPSGAMGSGIYSPFSQSTIYAYSAQRVSRLVISDVASPPRHSFDPQRNQAIIPPLDIEVPGETHTMLYDDLADFNVTFLEGDSGNVTTCDFLEEAGEICCHLSYAVESHGRDTFALGAFSGKVVIQNQYSWLAQSCAFVLCSAPGDVASCGRPPKAERNAADESFVVFELSADFRTPYVYPSAINSNYDLLVPHEISFSKKTGPESSYASIQTKNAVGGLAYAGLYARLHQNDREEH